MSNNYVIDQLVMTGDGSIAMLEIWLGLWYMTMGYYAILCGFFPERGLSSFTRNYKNTQCGSESTPQIEMIKLIGIIYGLSAVLGLGIVGCRNSNSNRLLCIVNAIYTFLLCLLIRRGVHFWDYTGAMKNLPLIFLNVGFAIL